MQEVPQNVQQEHEARQEHIAEIKELIQSFPPSQLSSLVRWLRFLKNELMSEPRLRSTTDSEAFWSSFGSWQDERDADTIVQELRQARRSSRREIFGNEQYSPFRSCAGTEA